MCCFGLYLATNLAVCPDSVITIINFALTSSAVLTAALQTASGDEIGLLVYLVICRNKLS